VRLRWRKVALAGVIALLAPSTIAVGSPGTPAAAAQGTAAASAPAAAPVVQHKTARLCSTVKKAGHVTCFAVRQTDTVEPAALRANAVSPQVAPFGYGPQTLVDAYKLDQSKGSGDTVAIVDAFDDPHAAADLSQYRAQYNMPACTTANGCFRKVGQTGLSTLLPPPDTTGWAGEISLDLDMVSATCPKCHILLVEATDDSMSNLGTAVNRAVALGAKYVSNSYGAEEDVTDPSSDAAYYHHPGVAITASTGDYSFGASYPATGKYVTAVGGTSLTWAPNTRGWTETVWSGTGSGCSAYVGKPSFQTSITTGCSNRAEADVSAVADPNTGMAVYDTYQAPGWQVFGGTSVSSPIIASVYALAGTPGASDSPNTYPSTHTSSLYDVTSGNNGTCSPSVLCTAGPGWDGPTGFGTPDGAAAFTPNTVAVTNPGAQSSATGTSQSLQIQAQDSGSGSQLSYAATGLPPGLAINSGTGLILGTPTALGRNTVTTSAKDGTSATGSTTFTWVIRAPGVLTTVSPARVLDTRSGVGAVAAPVGPGAELVLQVAGRGGVPATGVSAVVVNVTVTQPAAPGGVSAFADGAVLPPVSNLNFVAGQTVSNLAIAAVGADGKIRFNNGSAGTVQLVADVSGYYLAGTPTTPGALVTVSASRVLDTQTGIGAAAAPVGPGADLVLPVVGSGGVPATGVSAVVVNLTVSQPAAPGWVSAFADGGGRPLVSNLNFVSDLTVSNLAIVPVGVDGAIRLHNGSAGTVELAVDVSGYHLGGAPTTPGALVTVSPSRVLDTRTGIGALAAPVGQGAELVLQVAGRGGVPATGVSAVVVNLTVTQPAAPGWVSAFADGAVLPPVSNLNFVASQTVPNLAIAAVGADGKIRLHNGPGGTVQLVADVCGYYLP
jgi:hypothetical protein